MSLRYCSLASGSSGNCHFLSSGKTRVLVDAGCSMRYIRSALSQIDEAPEDIQAVFISHEHRDHVIGLGPLARKYGFMLMMHRATYQAVGDKLENISSNRIHLIEAGSFRFEDLDIEAFTLSHDAENTFGFTFSKDSSRVGIATDLGTVSETVFNKLQTCQLISIDCNYDAEMLENGPYPEVIKKRIASKTGHLSNQDAGNLINALHNANGLLRKVILSHMSHENNNPSLALKAVQDIMRQANRQAGKTILLEVASRNQISNPSFL